jgi:hypothetical protein
MNLKQIFKLFTLVSIVFLTFTSCEQDEINFEEPNAIENAEESTIPRATYGTRNIWFSHSNGSYSSSKLKSDFGNDGSTISSSEYGRLKINSKALRVTIPANTVGNASGVWAKVNIQKGNKYTLEYKVRFESGFAWSRGGKLFGLSGGASYSGCKGSTLKSKKDGWSFRPMFRKESGKSAWFMPYAYHMDMQTDCGDSFGKERNGLSKGTWYTIKMIIKMNTGSSNNGVLKMFVNGTTLLSKTNMKWSTTSAGREIDKLMFDVYRGGNANDWKSSKTGYITIDNVKITRHN